METVLNDYVNFKKTRKFMRRFKTMVILYKGKFGFSTATYCKGHQQPQAALIHSIEALDIVFAYFKLLAAEN